MSSELLNFIVQNLNREPFELNYTPLQLDQLPSNQLVQLLSDVLSWIFNTDKIDIRRETSEDTAIRILHSLKILRFKPPSDIEELEEWRAGIVEGAKKSVFPVLHYIFDNIQMLKERAYLATFLMKTDVPSDVHDFDTAQLQNEISVLMDQFKVIAVVEVNTDVIILGDIKQDLRSMEQEKETLQRKIEKAERKIKEIPYFDRHMENAAQLRMERERISEYTLIKGQERHRVIHVNNKVGRWSEHLDELQAVGENIDPSDMIVQLEEECETNNYLVREKLEEELRTRTKRIEELSQISQMAAIEEADIARLNAQITDLTSKIKRLENEREKAEEPVDENMSVFRHQAAALDRKKSVTAEKLQQARQELQKMQKEVETRKAELQNKVGGEVISAVQFRKYVENLRAKTVEYKRKRAEIDEMQCEKAILKRTVDLLNQRFDLLRTQIETMGGEVVQVFEVPLHQQRPKTAAPKSDNPEELQHSLKSLMTDIHTKKEFIEQLRREKSEQAETAKEAAQLESSMESNIEQKKHEFAVANENILKEVRSLEKESTEAEEIIAVYEQEYAEVLEDKNSMSQYSNQDYENELEASIEEENGIYSEINADGSVSKVDESRRQVELWQSLIVIFEAKLEALQERLNTGASDGPMGDHSFY
ncbi:unnamed protein product [Caenorhabditis auriculariae]|uniref:Intraflagellar transport protein 81 homolog n=1 Tax=Caenorhabditis auriculariae TaxID=2777116 RepID=A0A8S1GRJ4_9PELO|nr:unnamed protein product [Caenorhabditis auriculariae]